MEAASESEVIANIRRRVCGIMSKSRAEFPHTPEYDDYLEAREDLIGQFIDLQAIDSVDEASTLRDRLNTVLADYEIANEEQILTAKAVEEERKKERAKKIAEIEGLLYERINTDYHSRDNVKFHPMDPSKEASALTNQPSDVSMRPNNEPTVRRKCRLIATSTNNTAPTVSVAETISETLQASGVVGLWKIKATQSIVNALKSSNQMMAMV